jgi:hypothetical protein
VQRAKAPTGLHNNGLVCSMAVKLHQSRQVLGLEARSRPRSFLTMHSGRAGMTTLLATAGFDAAYIKEYGFWSTEAYEGYIRGTVFARRHPQPHYVPNRNTPVAEVLRLRGVVIAREWV